MHSSLQRAIWITIFICVGGLIYTPGLNGPFLYDDYSNLIDNRYLKIETLDLQSILLASFSIQSGPLYRPVAMASFAINSYFAGGFASATSFRITNIAIHLLNGLLIYWFLYLILERFQQVSTRSARAVTTRYKPSNHILASVLAFLWLVHPINLTSVLYIVQRMTSLAALFTLLALVSYLIGRSRAARSESGGYWLLIGGPVVFGTLGALSKESALLLPIFILLLELLLFRKEPPWKQWRKLSSRTKWLIGGAIALLVISVVAVAFDYSSSRYTNRDFTMWERVLTEARVLMLYLSLIVFPRLDDFGIYHDDIALSRSLLDPPTTVLAMLAIVGLLALASTLHRRSPLVTLGIAWFFASHLLESTIFPLEIAHEHRNYLSSLALPIILAGMVRSETIKLGNRSWFVMLLAVGICFATMTYMRASQWSEPANFYLTEARHHPNSANANAGLGYFFIYHGKIAEGAELLRRAVNLNPHDPGPLINLAALSATRNASINEQDLEMVDTTLMTFPTTATTQRALQFCDNCILNSCHTLAPRLEHWLRIVLKKAPAKSDYRSVYYYLLGRSLAAQAKVNEAIEAYRTAYELDPADIIPLFGIAQIYLDVGRPDYAQIIAHEIQRANQLVSLPRDRELRELKQLIETAKQHSKL